MNAQDLPFTRLFDGPKQFVVPVFQRDYSWTTRHCEQLWNDIIRVGNDPGISGHFIGSVVYIAAEENTAGTTRWLLIDGQQRVTTLTLLYAAIRDVLTERGEELESPQSAEEVDEYYLHNRHGKGQRKYKLVLRRTDQASLAAILDGTDAPRPASEHITLNYNFFRARVENTDIAAVFAGIAKLVIVHVCLVRGQDDPQMIFESLNSTGLDLTQADLIRNFVLMRQDEENQTRLYEQYWQPVELAFGKRYRTDFDKFIRDYLILRLRPSKQFRAGEIYHQFRTFFYHEKRSVDELLDEIKRFAGYYTAFSLGQEERPSLREAFRRLRLLVEVASPVVLKLYDCYDHQRTLQEKEFLEAVELLESYIFRRSVCDMQTRSLGQIFAQLAYRIDPQAPLLSLKVALYRLGKKRRYPQDAEFREALETRDVYDMRNCHYLLDRLENHSKEQIDTSGFSIEHVLPQNENLSSAWQTMLGPEWKQVQETWLHRLGNVTLTGYNPEYSDRPFLEKKRMPGGFDESPLRLNQFIKQQNTWTAAQIEERGKLLARKALVVWPALQVSLEAVQQAELEERKAMAARHSIDELDFNPVNQALFEALRPRLLAIGEDVVELCGAKSITYRVYDYFVELLPRKNRLLLLLNIDLDELDDPSGNARDTSEHAFITNAEEEGGVLFNVRRIEDIPDALHVVRQAYERIAE